MRVYAQDQRFQGSLHARMGTGLLCDKTRSQNGDTIYSSGQLCSVLLFAHQRARKCICHPKEPKKRVRASLQPIN